MKLTKNFTLREFVPKSIYEKYGEYAMRYIDSRLANGAQLVRDHLHAYFVKEGSDIVDLRMIINNESRDESGYRKLDSKTGSLESQHKFGRAIDFEVHVKYANGSWGHLASLEVQRVITLPEIWKYLRTYWTSMEKGTIGWTHLDMRFMDTSDYHHTPFLIPIPK